MHVVALVNQKGGVGRTTTAVNLSACLAEKGKSVVLVDLDPQGNATMGVGCDPLRLEHTIYDVFLGKVRLDEVLLNTKIRGLQVAPANTQLYGAEVTFSADPKRLYLLRTALQNWRLPTPPEVVVIDPPPALGLMTLNALLASTALIIPVDARYYAIAGVSILNDTLTQLRQDLGHHLRLLGVVVTMFDKTTNIHRSILHEIQKAYGSKVFSTIIGKNIAITEAEYQHEPVNVYAPGSSGAQNYGLLADEVITALDHA